MAKYKSWRKLTLIFFINDRKFCKIFGKMAEVNGIVTLNNKLNGRTQNKWTKYPREMSKSICM